MERDISVVQDKISNSIGVDINIVEKPKDLTNGRVKYSDYNWEFRAGIGEYAMHISNHNDPKYTRINYAIIFGCISETDGDYYYDQFESIVRSFQYEKLPRDSTTATDEQIQAAYNWRDQEIENLVNPLDEYCEEKSKQKALEENYRRQ